MPAHAEVLDLIRDVFRETLPHRPLPADDTPLFGEGGVLDSIDLVNFAYDVEETVNQRYAAAVAVANERAMSRSKSPFRSLSALAEFCVEQLS